MTRKKNSEEHAEIGQKVLEWYQNYSVYNHKPFFLLKYLLYLLFLRYGKRVD